jgi:pimeloyl-ACP methyl ester carboxylesterase
LTDKEDGMFERGMELTRAGARRLSLVLFAVVIASLAIVSVANAKQRVIKVNRTVMEAPAAPGTPSSLKIKQVGTIDLNKVGIIKVAAKGEEAKNVLVLEPGTSAAAAYFVPLAKSLVESTKGWQVWAVERRQTFLENQKQLTKYKFGKLVTNGAGEDAAEQFFNFYLGYLSNPAVTKHYAPVPDSQVEFAKEWGMNVAVEDLKVVIDQAKELGGKVVLGGHSLGGSVVTAYATWDFAGKPGAEGLSGLVYDDGGSSPVAVSEEEAQKSLEKLDQPGETPWLAFGGIPAPDLGLFSATGAGLTTVEPKGPSLLEKFPFLPPDLRSPIAPVTNEAGFGFSVNVGTSPASLAAAQIHGGVGVEEATEADGLHGWDGEGNLTPVSRYAEMLTGTGLKNASGSEWYFPARLTLDTGAVGNGLENPAQKVLGLHSTMGTQLPKSLHILAIDSELDKLFGGGTTLNEAEALAAQSGIPASNLTLIEAKETYAHNDPAGATPANNEFFKKMVPFLEELG